MDFILDITIDRCVSPGFSGDFEIDFAQSFFVGSFFWAIRIFHIRCNGIEKPKGEPMARPRGNKKQEILQAATGLFAAQGFDGTTTLQISKEAGITEPVIYYHFKGKDDLFARIIITAFAKFFSQMDALPSKTETEFEKIENLIILLLDIVKKMPDEIYLAVSTCPSRLKDPEGICRKSVQEMRRRLEAYLAGCLEKGIRQGEFHSVPVDATVNLLSALLNGLIRRRGLKLKEVKKVKETAVEFCRRSLVKNALGHR